MPSKPDGAENGDERSALDILSEQYSTVFEEHMRNLCGEPYEHIPPRLMEAMSYSLLAGGKRLRPALCLAAAERSGVSPGRAMPMAIATEFMHTASLIHDDLPCMDDDDLRRGLPTSHKKFGECLAVLAGDSLMIWSFGYALSHLPPQGIPAERVVRAVGILSESSGPAGMCGGQVLDTDAQSREDREDFVYRIASSKTAALIRASLVSGAMLGDITDTALQCYYDYGTHLGLAFQIVDDILDVTSTADVLGKTPNKDETQHKLTFVSAYGIEQARQMALKESIEAERAMESLFPEGDLLIDLARSLVNRSY
ncbi:MAG: polyprenyl synthetase family protein [Synergistaceae bacterium]|jgi:geranylgeranyl diphosphate synthase type II|nr:polyprenyl synthetase family protein [Synergistaceae bacterium]